MTEGEKFDSSEQQVDIATDIQSLEHFINDFIFDKAPQYFSRQERERMRIEGTEEGKVLVQLYEKSMFRTNNLMPALSSAEMAIEYFLPDRQDLQKEKEDIVAAIHAAEAPHEVPMPNELVARTKQFLITVRDALMEKKKETTQE